MRAGAEAVEAPSAEIGRVAHRSAWNSCASSLVRDRVGLETRVFENGGLRPDVKADAAKRRVEPKIPPIAAGPLPSRNARARSSCRSLRDR